MPKTSGQFNKKILSLLIEKARGDRTTKEFADECGISYVQLHKLEMCMQDSPPGKKLLRKLAENSVGGIEIEDYYFACGVIENIAAKDKKPIKSLDIQSKYDLLSSGQKKTVYDFVDYLLNYKK